MLASDQSMLASDNAAHLANVLRIINNSGKIRSTIESNALAEQIVNVTGQPMRVNSKTELQAQWNSLTPEQQSAVAAKITPPGTMKQDVAATEQELTKLQAGFVSHATAVAPAALKPFATELSTALGTVAVGLGAGLVLAEIQIVSDPAGMPVLAENMGQSIANSFITTYKALANPASESPAATGAAFGGVALTAVMIAGVPGLADGLYQVATYIEPQGIPASSIAIEGSTGRLPINVDGVDPTDIYNAGRQAMIQAMSPDGAGDAVVPVENSNIAIRVLRTPYQQSIGDVVWSGTNEGLLSSNAFTVDPDTGIITVGNRSLYTDPDAAMNFTAGAPGNWTTDGCD